METERITLSQRERDRMRVLHEVKQGHLTQREAGRRLRLSDRQVRRLLLRIGKYGDQAVIHALRGRPSIRKFPASFERNVLVRVGQRYTTEALHAEREGCHSEAAFSGRRIAANGPRN